MGSPQALRATLEDLGPMFVKIGEGLSIRSDLLPEAHAAELMLLRDRAAPTPWREMERVIAEDLGRAPAEAFGQINTTPVVAGALSQVYVALTHAGDRVAVKVQRPGIAAEIDRALEDLEPLHRALAEIEGWDPPAIDVLRREVRDGLRDELDFERELRNTALLEAVRGPARFVRTPVPYPEHSGPRVLTTEYLDGVPFTELMAVVGAKGVARLADLRLDRRVLADNLVRAVLEQAFTLGPFHVAPHPGNLIALPDNQIGVVDFGVVDQIDESALDHTLALAAAVYADDTSRTVGAAVDLLEAPTAGRDAFRVDFAEDARRWGLTATLDVLDAGAVTLSHHMRSVMRLSRRHGLTVPSSVLTSYRAVLAAETVATLLSAESGLQTVGRPFFVRQQLARLTRELSLGALQGLGFDVVNALTDGPGQLQRLVGDLADDRFVFRVATTESPGDRVASNRRARLVTAAIVFVGLAILASGVGTVLQAILLVAAAGALAATALLWVRLR